MFHGLVLCLVLAQVSPKAFFPAHSGALTIGDGIRSIGTLNGTDEQPFEAALMLLQHGGEIEVLPGDYAFTKSVAIRQSGVTITGSSAAVLHPASTGPVGLLLIGADGVRVTGVNVVADAPASNQAAIKILGDDCTIDHCRLSTRGPAQSFFMIDAGFDDGVTVRTGTLIEGNVFTFGGTSSGVVGYRGRNGIALRMIGNEFREEPGVGTGLCRYAIQLEAEGRGSITANTIQNLGSLASPCQGIIYSNADTEGHHLAITGNFLEACIAPLAIHLRGGRFCTITGNVFGRFTQASYAVVVLDMSTGAKSGNSNVVSSNQFHNNSGLAIFAQQQQGVNISANQCTLCATRQVEIAASVKGAHISGNQFVKDSLPTSVAQAILIDGGSGHFIHDNSATSDHPTMGFSTLLTVNNVLLQSYNASGNWTFP